MIGAKRGAGGEKLYPMARTVTIILPKYIVCIALMGDSGGSVIIKDECFPASDFNSIALALATIFIGLESP